MSFILDALKKSENDRQRQSGPALFEVRVAPPRSRFPSWAIALVGLLLVNLGVVAWLMFRKPASAATPPMQAAADARAAVPTPIQPPPVQPAQVAPVQSAPAPMQSAPAYAQTAPPQNGAYGNPQNSQYPPPQQQGGPTLTQAPYSYPNSNLPPQQQRPPDDPQYTNNGGGNPDDYAPAAEPTGPGPLGHVRRGLDNGLMTYEEASSKNQIPPLRMDLHVYAPDPRQRFVLVNMKRLHEGDSLPEGVKVDSITTDGVILSYRGIQFMMERD